MIAACLEGSGHSREDASAVEVLALTPDGRLVLRNSRLDADPDNSTAGAERRDRYDQWRERLNDLRAPAGAPGGAVPPGVPGPMGEGSRGS